MFTYDTVVEAISGLKARGYIRDFNLDSTQLICSASGHCLQPEDFEIIETHRFEGESNPSDEDVVYAIESKDGIMKGVFTSAFGVYADAGSTEMMQKFAKANTNT